MSLSDIFMEKRKKKGQFSGSYGDALKVLESERSERHAADHVIA
jgi:hypothetical protein